MRALITKELKDFWSNGFGAFAIAILIVLVFLFLWIFPDSAYTTYGLAEGDLYFQFMSYLLLFVVPIFAVSFLSNEYNYGTEELLRSLSIDWSKAILAKFIAAFLILGFIIALTSVHLYVIQQLPMNKVNINLPQLIGAYFGLLGVGACFIGISLMVTSYVEHTTASYIISIFVCFMMYSGLSFLSGLPSLAGGVDFWVERLSMSYHADQIARGLLRLSTIVYLIGVVIWSLWVASHRLSTKEV